MATNLLNPNGFNVARTALGLAATYSGKQYTILNGYGTNIGKGDPVKWGTGASQGTIILATPADIAIIGIFQGVLPYYDTTLQATGHGLNGAYVSTIAPISGSNVPCMVYDDPFTSFVAQVNGGPWLQNWQGQNINFAASAPNSAGSSTIGLVGSTVGTSNTLPFQIINVTGIAGGPQDPTNINPWIEVRMNTAQMLATTGV